MKAMINVAFEEFNELRPPTLVLCPQIQNKLLNSRPLFYMTFIFFIFCSSCLLSASNLESIKVPDWEKTTLKYSNEEIDYLKKFPEPNRLITSEQLSQLTKELEYFVNTEHLSDTDLTIMPAYIANAQNDFAQLSYRITGNIKGNLGPVTLWSLQLFVPAASLPSVQEECFDVFSSLLSAVVVSKYAKRLNDERKEIRDYPVKNEEGLWKPASSKYGGLNYGSTKTWFLTSSKEFIADAPPENRGFWESQTRMIKEEQSKLDGRKVQKVFEWAGLTSVHAGSLEHYLYDFLERKRLPVLEELSIRALYFSAIADSNTAAFNSKYTFWVMRPSQRDKGVKPLIVIPNHPSYPSAHSTISATASTIMSALFPEDSEEWNQMADEAGMSRIWGGIHYPIDHKNGQQLGRNIGKAILDRDSKSN